MGVEKIKGGDDMILKDMLNRIDDNTGVRVFDNNGVLMDYDFSDMLNERYNDFEIIFPISVKDNKIEIWIDTEVA